MIKTRSKRIDEKEISVTQLPGRRALRLKTRLLKLVGPSFSKLLGQAKNVTAEADIGPALELLADKLDPHDFESLVLEILSGTRIDGTEINESSFDLIFGGEMLLMYKVVAFSLKVQFEDFFGSSVFTNLVQRAQAITQSQPTQA